ncbi:MAG: hypothetical protein OEX21_01585 [Betaproteobacteria bacterium]|nr:hypothetical protein [Betaproteobacteria bacterium]
MKDIAQKDLPDVSGGISPDNYLPHPPVDIGGEPIGPLPEPLPGHDDPRPFVLEQ